MFAIRLALSQNMQHMNNKPSEQNKEQPDQSALDFQSILGRLEDGDSLAMMDFFDRYSQQLLRLAEKNIHPVLLKRFDGEDVVQSVFRTFFRRHQEGKLKINRSDQLWKLLVTITVCKTRTQARRHTAARRNVQAEQLLASEVSIENHQATPDDALALWEEIDTVLQGLPRRAPEILNCRLEGKGKTEIAEELNLSRQTIHRILKLIEDRLRLRFHGFSMGNQSN